MAKDIIPGGLADNKTDKDFPKDQLDKGVKVEMEHTSNKSIAKEIARDHLEEDKKYYDKLQKMEKSAFWQGFEKQANLAGMAGKFMGTLRNAPAAIGSAITSAPAVLRKGVNTVKAKMQHNQRSFDVMQRRALGSSGRQGAGVANQSLDFSGKAQVAQARKARGMQTPARIQANNKAKPGMLSKARDLATLGAVTGAGGMYLASKDQAQYEQPRQ